jgi:hypothetical protein
MPYSFIFRDKARQADLEPTCSAVISQFVLPEKSLFCIFDDVDRQEFIELPGFGTGYLGFFGLVRDEAIGDGSWPWDIVNELSNVGDGIPYLCDVLIYLRSLTCKQRVGAAITFAHELQHFMQYGYNYKVWRAHPFLQAAAIPKLVNPKAWNFPLEHEAILVSKRVSVEVMGKSTVDQYAEDRISNGEDPEKWRFFLDLDPCEKYDLLEETRAWTEKYRSEIIGSATAKYKRNGDPDFTSDDWWR